jgi:hypothetical protein
MLVVGGLAGERGESVLDVREVLVQPVRQHHITEEINHLIIVSLAADVILPCIKMSCP